MKFQFHEREVKLPRRRLLIGALIGAGLINGLAPLVHASPDLLIENVTRLYPVKVARVVLPSSAAEVVQAVQSWPGQIAVGGGRYSMGGQVGVEGGLHIDMRKVNALVWLRPQEMAVRVQAGMRWRDLQDHLDPADLSVRTMQSYSNFTVGGSVSVNVHGRYVGHGPIGRSVRSLQIVLADGKVVEANRQQNRELFRAALGGYGALGVITEIELELDRNRRIERSIAHVQLADYPGYFKSKVKGESAVLMHNADLLPPMFDVATAVNWSVTDKALTVQERLVARGKRYALEQSLIWAVTELPKGDLLQRKVVRPLMQRKPEVVWRNYEASLDAASLEPKSRTASTYVLQEYFVPVRHFVAYTRQMATVIRRHGGQVLNVSVRHSPADEDSVMAWAPEEVFSFVVYYKQGTDAASRQGTATWTRDMVATALEHDGSYYLPYQRHATQSQFDAAYPQKSAFQRIKAEFDPGNRMSNELWRQYL